MRNQFYEFKVYQNQLEQTGLSQINDVYIKHFFLGEVNYALFQSD